MKTIFFLMASCCLSVTHAQLNDYPFKTIVGDPTPSFTMKNLENQNMHISDFRGKVVVINLFASWCPPCIEEMPILDQRLAKRHGHEDLVILAVGYGHVSLEMEYFEEDHDYDFEYIPDFDKDIFTLFADRTIPRNIVLDRSGQIIFQSVGYFPDELERMISVVDQEIAGH